MFPVYIKVTEVEITLFSLLLYPWFIFQIIVQGTTSATFNILCYNWKLLWRCFWGL